MPTYKAPVSDTVFLLNDVFDYARYANAPGFSEAPIDIVEAVLSEGAKFVEEVVQPLNRVGDIEGCKRHDDGSVTTPKGFKEAYKALVDGGWVGLAGDPAYGGQGLPRFLAVLFSEYGNSANIAFCDVSRPDQWRGRGADRPRRRGAQGPLSAEDDHRRVDRHDVLDRAALRHRSRPHQDPRGSAGRRLLFHHRPEDLHLRRRARSDRKHRSHGAGANRRRSGRGQGHLALPRAEIRAERRWRRRRAQRRRLRLDRAQDGHSRQYDGGAQFRRRQGLAGRRAASRAARDVRDDERRPARRRRPGPRRFRGRLSERRRLRQGAPAGPLAQGPGRTGEARRPAPGPSRRPPHAARSARLQRRRRARSSSGSRSPRTRPAMPRTRRRGRRPTIGSA